MLTDDHVIYLRKAARENMSFDFEAFATEAGVKIATALKAMNGNTFKHLNASHPVFIRVVKKEKEQARARELYKSGQSLKQVVKILHVSKASVSLWCKDLIAEKKAQKSGIQAKKDAEDALKVKDLYKKGIPHLEIVQTLKRGNRFVYEHSKDVIREAGMPSRRINDARVEEDKSKVREMYRAHHTISEITGSVHRSWRTVTIWCADLIAEHNALPLEHQVSISRKRRTQKLLDKEVVALRRESKEKKFGDIKAYAAQYKCSTHTIALALRGVTFAHLNILEPPFPGPFSQLRANAKKRGPDEALAREAVVLRRADPIKWTYTALAKWMEEKTGKKYGAGGISTVLLNRDPSLKALEVPVVKPKVSHKPKVILTEAQKAAKALKAKQARAELREFMRLADLYEATPEEERVELLKNKAK